MYFLDALSKPEVTATISVLIMLAFAAAFYFSYLNNKINPSVFIISAALFINFVIANNALYEFLAERKPDIDYYLRWVQYDSLTIIGSVIAHYVFKVKHHKLTSIIMYLLLVNICMYMAVHIDIIEHGNREPWWLWTLYTPVINTVEIAIAFLIIYESRKELADKAKRVV